MCWTHDKRFMFGVYFRCEDPPFSHAHASYTRNILLPVWYLHLIWEKYQNEYRAIGSRECNKIVFACVCFGRFGQIRATKKKHEKQTDWNKSAVDLFKSIGKYTQANTECFCFLRVSRKKWGDDNDNRKIYWFCFTMFTSRSAKY